MTALQGGASSPTVRWLWRWWVFGTAIAVEAFVLESGPRRLTTGRGACTRRAAAPELLSDLSSVASKYDALLLDQFGVLHDGKTCYDGSAEAVRALQQQGMRIVVLSNSSKRRRDTVERLHALQCGMCTWLDAAELAPGVPLISVVTSGDVCHQGLSDAARGLDPGCDVFSGLAGVSRAFVFGNGDDDEPYLTTAGLLPASIQEADFILARGLFCLVNDVGPRELDAERAANIASGSVDDLLEEAAARKLPMLVANPDLVRPDSNSSPMPGSLGLRYQEKYQADVRFVGKPHPRVYEVALEALRKAGVHDKSRIAAVGDSMHHDVLGARKAGIDAIFVAGGVHADDLEVAQGQHQPVDAAVLERFLSSFPEAERPTTTIPGFVF